jgi:competence protein ComEC
MEILCFLAGVSYVYTKSLLYLVFLVVTGLLSCRWAMVIWFLLGTFWNVGHEWWIADQGMPRQNIQIIPTARLEGEIVAIPINKEGGGSQFQFLLARLNDKRVRATVLLSCYNHCPQFKVGERWHFQAKLKKPRNLENPGGFDYVRFLQARHIHWTGYIQSHSAQRVGKDEHLTSLVTLREHLAGVVEKLIPKTPSLGIIEALTVGLTSHIEKAQWELFRRTGTTHLMVISGAHIGLVAGFSFALIRWLWTLGSRLCLYYPAPKAASFFSLWMAVIYALLAGFGAPAQRALVACFFLLLKNFLPLRVTSWQAWRYSLLAVLLFEPHNVLLPGFYLSFIAVACLILSSQRFSFSGFKKSLCLQLACLFGLMPLTLYWFSYGALDGLIANFLAIPWVGFIVVPLSLLSLLIVQIWPSSLFLEPVNWAIKLLLYYLRCVDSFSMVNLQFSFNTVLSALALMLAMLLVFFFPLRPIFPAIVILTLTGLFRGFPLIKKGEAQINVLDVGQGLAVVVRTAKHTLIYDTGAKFYGGGDMAKLAIIPFLEHVGIKKVDKVIISHPDMDHRGGLSSLEKRYRIAELLVNDVTFYHRGKNCHDYPSWNWDGISFRFLAIRQKFTDRNNGSCILKIETKTTKLLLPGDIEKLGETYLSKAYGNDLQANILVVPHHGSKTSSSPLFIKNISPEIAVISSGFDNRYHFPHQQTLATLQAQKAKIINTAECGMFSVRISNDQFNNNKFVCQRERSED